MANLHPDRAARTPLEAAHARIRALWTSPDELVAALRLLVKRQGTPLAPAWLEFDRAIERYAEVPSAHNREVLEKWGEHPDVDVAGRTRESA